MAYKRKYKSKTRSKRPYKKRSVAVARRRFAQRVKRVILKTAEPKHRNYSWGKTEHYHNTVSLFHLNAEVCMPPQGDADSERIGDEIQMSGFAVRILLGQKADRPNVKWRWLVVKTPKGSTYSYTAWFENIINNVLLDPPNKDFLKVLAQGVWDHYPASLEVGETAKEQTYPKKLWIPYKHKLKFGPGSGQKTHNDDDIWFVMAPFDAYGTSLTDNIAYSQFSSSMYFKDP